MTDQTLLLENFLPYRLNRLANLVSREFARLYKERFDLTRPEWRTLATLGQFGTLTATDIGVHSSMHKTMVSRAVAKLEERRWLSRQPDESDRRLERVTLTTAGDRIYRELVPVAQSYEDQLLRRLGEPGAKSLMNALDLIEHMLEPPHTPSI